MYYRIVLIHDNSIMNTFYGKSSSDALNQFKDWVNRQNKRFPEREKGWFDKAFIETVVLEDVTNQLKEIDNA